jgi:hypothetical protein
LSKEAVDWAQRQFIPDGTMKPLLKQLAYMHKPGRDLFPSQAFLADAIGRSGRTVREGLRLLEYFGLIKRKARSNGAKGRTSDLFELVMDREFTLTKRVIADAHKALRKRRTSPVANPNSQPAKSSGAPGEIRQGIGDLAEGPIQEGANLKITTKGLRIIDGGRR